jgi:hypothetical protein
MSNPTSSFGWIMPTSTDLVTDLPADFEVFGQAVDSDLADLLGGTTGQVLSKTSATDLAFTWIRADDTKQFKSIVTQQASNRCNSGSTSGDLRRYRRILLTAIHGSDSLTMRLKLLCGGKVLQRSRPLFQRQPTSGT